MRVIAGRFRGRRLRTVDGLSVRPATDRVRQTIFDMLATRLELDGAEVLDLFAGSGSLGFEALSRGAGRVTFVESRRDAADCIEANARTLECLPQTAILEADAFGFALATSGQYDLVFADPPYAFPRTAELPGLIFGRGLVRPGGLLLIEHAADLRFPESGACSIGPVKKFGRTCVTFFRHAAPPPPSPAPESA